MPFPGPVATDPMSLARLANNSGHLFLLTDYDGTLVPLAARPELAAPDSGLIILLERLAERDDRQIHILSGRLRAEVDRWFGALPLGLHAEHGVWSRFGDSESWVRSVPPVDDWPVQVINALRQANTMLPGSFLEFKSASIALHYREVSRDNVASNVPSVRERLAALADQYGLSLLDGSEVVEIRTRGLSKANAVRLILEHAAREVTVMALGDDSTDEEMFGALPSSAITVHVGPGSTRARFRLSTPLEVRALLSELSREPQITPGSAREPGTIAPGP